MTTTGIYLLSALRRCKSKAALYEVSPDFFAEGQERNAYVWLREYVEQYKQWPTPQTMRVNTGLATVITKEPIDYYLTRSRDKAIWAYLHGPFSQIKRALADKEPQEALQFMRSAIAESMRYQNARSSGIVTLTESLDMVDEDYRLAKASYGLRGIPTGWPFMDEQTDGWQNGDVITVLARPGRGKTYWLLHSALTAHLAGHSVLFLSMEMGVLALARRMLGIHTRMNPRFLRRGSLGTYAEQEMRRQKQQWQENAAPFYWLAGNFKKTIPALKAAAYETEADIIFADASYLIKPEGNRYKAGSRRESVADTIEEIGSLNKEINRPIVQSVQFNRQAIKPKREEGEDTAHNPVAHLTLEKAGETDVVGQVSAAMIGLELGDSPNETTERYAGLMKGREGEQGWYKYHYKFQPVDFSQICDHRSANVRGNEPIEDVNLGFMT